MIDILSIEKKINECNNLKELIEYSKIIDKLYFIYPEITQKQKKTIENLAKAKVRELAKKRKKTIENLVKQNTK